MNGIEIRRVDGQSKPSMAAFRCSAAAANYYAINAVHSASESRERTHVPAHCYYFLLITQNSLMGFLMYVSVDFIVCLDNDRASDH